VRGKGNVRTGVTAILPRAKGDWDFVMAATCNENGNGDMTGVIWVKESGFLEGPILLTGPHSVGTIRDAAIEWQIRNGRGFIVTYPLVTETSDVLNDATGAHLKAEHAWAALDAANIGPVREGGVSGGTGMSCNGFNGGIGTSSRQVPKPGGGHHTLGILVQCNYSGDLAILGAPVRRERQDIPRLCTVLPGAPTRASWALFQSAPQWRRDAMTMRPKRWSVPMHCVHVNAPSRTRTCNHAHILAEKSTRTRDFVR